MRIPHLTALAVAALASSLVVGPAAAAPAGGEIRDSGGATAIAGSYLVVLKDARVTTAQVSDRAHSLAATYRGTVGHIYTSALRGFSIRMDEPQARKLAAHDEVAYVAQDHTVSLQSTTQPRPPSWGLDRIDQRLLPLNAAYRFPNTASNVTAYIIDTGIRITHTDFGGRARDGFDFVDNDPIAQDCDGHGTHVAGTVGGAAHGVAKSVRLVAVRVLGCRGTGALAGVVAGVDWVTANAVRPAVANMSLGVAGSHPALETAVRNSIASRVTYAVAAGNSNADACGQTPARVADAITVASSDRSDTRASSSSFGRCVDIFAPGVGITSAWSSSDTATNTISGTSMASPHVAGVAALILQTQPTFTPRHVRDTIVGRATPGVIKSAGSGSPNLLLFSPPEITVGLFLADHGGGVYNASGSPTAGWGQWSSVSEGSTTPGAPVTAAVTGPDGITLFLADRGGGPYTASGSPATGWGQWSNISEGSTTPGAPITAVVSGPDRITLFLAGPTGEVFTASGNPTAGWGRWSSVSEGTTMPGAPVTAVVSGPDRITLFLANPSGEVFTASGNPTAGWGQWSSVSQGTTTPGAPVTALVTGPDEITLFLADPSGEVFTASGNPAAGWGRWSSVSEGTTKPGAPVTAVMTRPDLITLFLANPIGSVFTVSGNPAAGWGLWSSVSEGSTTPGAPVTAVVIA